MSARPLVAGTVAVTLAIAVSVWAPPVAFGVPSEPDPVDVKFFNSPSGNISCEIDYQRGSGMPDSAYCVSAKPPQHVSMDSDGVLTLCTGVSCMSNGPEDQVTLPYGHSTGLGPFTCSSKVSGVVCTVGSGKGFTISNSGINSVG